MMSHMDCGRGREIGSVWGDYQDPPQEISSSDLRNGKRREGKGSKGKRREVKGMERKRREVKEREEERSKGKRRGGKKGRE